MSTKALLGVAQTAQAAGLLGKNIRLAKKKKATTKDFLKTGVTNIVGTELIKLQADITADL